MLQPALAAALPPQQGATCVQRGPQYTHLDGANVALPKPLFTAHTLVSRTEDGTHIAR